MSEKKRKLSEEINIYAETALKYLNENLEKKELCVVDVDAEYNKFQNTYVAAAKDDIPGEFYGCDEIIFDVDSAMKTNGYGKIRQKIQDHFTVDAIITSKELNMESEEFSSKVILPMSITMSKAIAKKIDYCITNNKKNNKYIGFFMPILNDTYKEISMKSISNAGVSIRVFCEFDPIIAKTILIIDCLFGCFVIDQKEKIKKGEII